MPPGAIAKPKDPPGKNIHIPDATGTAKPAEKKPPSKMRIPEAKVKRGASK
jgi:hypothetical protein